MHTAWNSLVSKKYNIGSKTCPGSLAVIFAFSGGSQNIRNRCQYKHLAYTLRVSSMLFYWSGNIFVSSQSCPSLIFVNEAGFIILCRPAHVLASQVYFLSYATQWNIKNILLRYLHQILLNLKVSCYFWCLSGLLSGYCIAVHPMCVRKIHSDNEIKDDFV